MKQVKELLAFLAVTPSKGRGQNFLLDPFFLQQIARAAGKLTGYHLIEIGPGLGALTEQLRGRGASLTAIEIEPAFAKRLRELYPEVTVVEQDVLTYDFSQTAAPRVLFGNIPYSISSPIVLALLQSWRLFHKVVLLVQREFAERLAAAPGSREYGRLSVAARRVAQVSLGATVGGGAFHPPAGVDSQIVVLEFLPPAQVAQIDEELLERVVQASFLERRKKIGNSLFAAGLIAKEQAAELLAQAQIDPQLRAENLDVADFIRLTEAYAAWRDNERIRP